MTLTSTHLHIKVNAEECQVCRGSFMSLPPASRPIIVRTTTSIISERRELRRSFHDREAIS